MIDKQTWLCNATTAAAAAILLFSVFFSLSKYHFV